MIYQSDIIDLIRQRAKPFIVGIALAAMIFGCQGKKESRTVHSPNPAVAGNSDATITIDGVAWDGKSDRSSASLKIVAE